MTDFSSVKGKVAVVTGAAKGLGKSIAQCFAQNGMKVVLADVDVDNGEKVVNELQSKDGDAVFVKADVSNEEDVKKMVDFALDTYGHLDGIVNNAGIAVDNRLTHEYTTTDFNKVMSINLKGVFLGMKYGAKSILKSKSSNGFIINIASLAGLLGHSSMSLYTSAKHGVVGLTKSGALDYAPYNITVNAICPGTFRTSIWRDAPETLIQEYGKIISPNGKLGVTKEIGHLALFLASDLARYISGAVIPIDAGSSAGIIIPS